MPSRSDSSYSLTARTSHSFTHLRVQRAWLQVILLLGFIQMILGVLIVTFSLLVNTIMPGQSIRHSCPIWAGFPRAAKLQVVWEMKMEETVSTLKQLAFSGLVGIVSWRRPFTPVITFFTLLSVLGIMLSLAGSVLSCQHAQLVRSLDPSCQLSSKDVCECCIAWSSNSAVPRSSCMHDVVHMYPNPDCPKARQALKDLLFSVCGLTIFSILVCALSALMCCIHIFSLDILHALSPPRSSSVTLDCTSPPDTFLQNMLHLEEFVPPVPPPPYYPPEYTCSSETDAQSITYNGSMDSPVPLYPTDFPPSYEAVMGLHGDSQVTLFDSQFTDTSHGPCTCNQIPSVVLSGEAVSMDSGSLVMSEIVDIPGDSSPSEDSCLLETGGSARSVDYVLFRSIQRSRADYCLSVDCGQCGLHPQSPTLQGPFEEVPRPRLRGERSYSCSTPTTGYEGLLEVGSALTHSCHRLEGLGHSVGPCFPEVRVKAKSSLPGRKGPERRQRRSSEASFRLPPACCPLLRSHSDPGITSCSDAGDFQEVFCTKALEDDMPNSSDTGATELKFLLLLRASSKRENYMAVSRMQENRSGTEKSTNIKGSNLQVVAEDLLLLQPISRRQRSVHLEKTAAFEGPNLEGCLLHPLGREPPSLSRGHPLGKAKLEVPWKVTQHLPKTATRSLGDLKVCRGTRGLMARFLHRSKRNLASPGVETVGNGPQGRKQVSRLGAERSSPEGIHLQSCGDLSSTSSLRRLLSARRLERRRPRSLSGLIRESNL